MPQPNKIEIELPDWLEGELERVPATIVAPGDRMRLIIRLSKLNYENGTGGPFAAGVFEIATGRLVAAGVNRVVPCSSSIAHAEIVAISLAQKRLGTFDLGGAELPGHQLVVNGRPCAMCFGAIPWSGIRSLMVAASGDQIESLTGFDEGPIHPQWKLELERRGIEVVEGVMADEACEVFRGFAASGQVVYNGRSGNSQAD